MPAKVSCPTCETTLRSTRPIVPGQKVKCPKCGEVFTAPGEDGSVPAAARPVPKASPAARRDGPRPAPRAAGRTDPPAGRKAATDRPPAKAVPPRHADAPTLPPPPDKHRARDSDEIAIYNVTDHGADQAEKINYVPDTTVRDPRGPAVAMLTKPSNALIYAGMMSALFCVFAFGYNVWPWVFRPEGGYVLANEFEETLTDRGVPREKIPKRFVDAVNRQELKTILDEAEHEENTRRLVFAVLAAVQFFYNLVMAVGAVKMQNLESYNWSIASAIMGINPMSLSGPGIWALVVLLKPEVKAAFEYRPDID